MKSFDWKLIAVLSLPGPVIGILTLYGIIPFGSDRWFWLGISILGALVIARRVERRAFGHGAVVGFLLGATSKLVQGVWSETYIAHNQEIVREFEGMPEGNEFKYFVLMLVPFVGVANGLIVGLMSHFAHKAMGRGSAK